MYVPGMRAVLEAAQLQHAETLTKADMFSRALQEKCWADEPNKDPKVERACNSTETSGCPLGLCPTHCIEIHRKEPHAEVEVRAEASEGHGGRLRRPA